MTRYPNHPNSPLPTLEAALGHAAVAFSVRAWLTIASGVGRGPASQVRKASWATPRAIAHCVWDNQVTSDSLSAAMWNRPSVRTMPSDRRGWKRMHRDEESGLVAAQKRATHREMYFSW